MYHRCYLFTVIRQMLKRDVKVQVLIKNPDMLHITCKVRSMFYYLGPVSFRPECLLISQHMFIDFEIFLIVLIRHSKWLDFILVISIKVSNESDQKHKVIRESKNQWTSWDSITIYGSIKHMFNSLFSEIYDFGNWFKIVISS